MRKKLLSFITDIVFYIIGCGVYSIAVTMFISPNEISPGGLTGIATVLNHLFMLPTGIVLFLLNIPILILGFIKFGGIFITKTAIATTILSFMLEITENLLPAFKIDLILAAVFGGILMGLGLSIVMLRGATTGGVDIIAKVINRKFRHLTVGRLILMSDAAVVMIAAFAYGNVQSALYSVISLYASSRIMDVMLYGADKGKIVYIITDSAKEISDAVMTEVRRGVTVMNVVGGYTGSDKKMLMCVLRRHEVSAVYRIVGENDSNAFIVVGEAGEIFGQGFKANR